MPTTKHGETKRRYTTDGKRIVSREYSIWQMAKDRCFNSRNKDYPSYGGRGITMSDQWRQNFATFLKDMGRCPDGMSLDRENNDGHYCKQNCRWATPIEQGNNNRRCKKYAHQGVMMTVAEMARKFLVDRDSLRRRISLGEAPHAAIAEIHHRKELAAKGIKRTNKRR